jgi:hypothetical protein
MESNGSKTSHVPRTAIANRQPIKVDLFELVIRNLGLMQLAPVFPYLHDGAIVPCMTNTTGVKDMTPWHFFHDNEVKETLVCMAENGGAMKTGQIMVLGDCHGVGPFLREPQDPASYYVALITVRMCSGPTQMEGIIMRCPKCSDVIYERHFNVKEGPERKYYPEFHALRYYAECWEEFNRDEQLRTCAKCGTVRPPEAESSNFGHLQYARNVAIANRGREAFEQMAARLTSDVGGRTQDESAARE